MIDSTSKIEHMIDLIDEKVAEHCDIFMIGGGALMYNEFKEYTKDIDFVVKDGKTYSLIENTMFELGFESTRPRAGMEKANISDTLKLEDYTIDLFEKTVCGQLQLSDSVVSRAKQRYSTPNVRLYTVSNEDIFLLKSVTEREGDVNDCISIIRKSDDFDWECVLDEVQTQMKYGSPVWISYVVERLCVLKEEGIFIPIFDEMLELERQYLKDWSKTFLEEHKGINL